MSEAIRRAQMERRLIERSLQDDVFRQQLLADPKAIIEREIGRQLPEEVRVVAMEETADTIYLVLPYRSTDDQESGELSDRDPAGPSSPHPICGRTAGTGSDLRVLVPARTTDPRTTVPGHAWSRTRLAVVRRRRMTSYAAGSVPEQPAPLPTATSRRLPCARRVSRGPRARTVRGPPRTAGHSRHPGSPGRYIRCASSSRTVPKPPEVFGSLRRTRSSAASRLV